MGIFIFFGIKNLYWGCMVQKVKIICSKWNLIPRLIRTCRIQWWCSLHLFRLEISFLGKFGRKMRIVSFTYNLVLSLTQIWRIQWWCSLFLFLNGGILLKANLFQRIKIVCWRWNLEPRLIWIYKIRRWFSCYSFLDWKYVFSS